MIKKPNLFVLGFQKCGTTLLTDVLGSHEEIFVPSIKETYFFIEDEQYERGYEWYINEYFTPADKRHKWIGEGTPFYACDQSAMERLCANTDVSSAKFVLVMRDPVKRAYSAYWHIRRLGREDLSFEDALVAEAERINAAKKSGGRWWRYAYKTVSSYGTHLAMVQALIPADNLLVLDDKDLRDPVMLRRQLATFLNIDANKFGDVRESNKASMPRFKWLQEAIIGKNPLKSLARRLIPRELRTKLAKSFLQANSTNRAYPKMAVKTELCLRASLKPEIERTAALTRRNFAHWLEPKPDE